MEKAEELNATTFIGIVAAALCTFGEECVDHILMCNRKTSVIKGKIMEHLKFNYKLCQYLWLYFSILYTYIELIVFDSNMKNYLTL